MLDVQGESLRAGLLPLVDLVDAANAAGGNAGLGQLGEQGVAVEMCEAALELLGERVDVFQAAGIGGVVEFVGVEAELGAQPSPNRLVAAGDLNYAVGAAERSVGGDGGVSVALGATDLAGNGPRGALEGMDADQRSEQ